MKASPFRRTCPLTPMGRTFLVLMVIGILFSVCRCASDSSERPPCTWEIWAVKGGLVNDGDGRSLTCGPGQNDAACVGMTHDDFLNLLRCGGPRVPKATPAATAGGAK